MTVPVSNVVVTTDTFRSWVDITNQLADAMSLHAVTAEANSTGANTTGNVNLLGIMSANVFAVRDGLRGGSVDTPANLSIVTNTSVTGANLYISANTFTLASNVYTNAASVAVVGGAFGIQSNVTVSNTAFANISPDAVSINSNTFSVTANASISAANVVVSAANTLIQNGNLSVTSNVSVVALTSLSGNVTVSGALHTVSGNVNFDGGTLYVDSVNNRLGVGNTTPGQTLTVAGTANVSSDFYVGGVTTLVGNATLRGTVQTISGNVSVDSGVLFVDSVANRVGINNTTPAAALTVTGNATISSTLVVTGATTLNNTSIGNSTLDVTANTAGSGSLTWTNQNIVLKSNSSVTAVAVSANSSATNTTIQGTNLVVGTTNIVANVATAAVTGNTILRGNTSVDNIVLTGNSTVTALSVQGTSVGISSNVTLTGTVHTVSGNVNIDSGVLFVDAANNRVGINNTTPDAALSVAGTANVSGAARFGGVVTLAANATAAANLIVTGDRLIVNTTGSFRNLEVNTTSTFTSNVHLNGTWVNSSANVVISNGNTHITSTTATVTGGTLNISSNTNVTGELAINSKLTVNSDYEVQVANVASIGANAGFAYTVYQYPASSFKSAKIFAQVTKGSSYQASEIIVVHNGNTSTTPVLTVFGTVNAPVAANLLATFTAVIVGSNVAIQATQTNAASGLKLVAQLIK